jgi:AraC family transcriptional regulator
MVIAGLRGHFTPPSWAGIPAQWQRLVSFMDTPAKIGAANYGLCFQMPDGVDYLSGFEVNGANGLPAEFTRVSIPAQHYAVFAHREHVSKLRDTLDAIWHKWLPVSGRQIARADAADPSFFERYGEKFDPQTGMGDIEVWVPVKS